MSFDRTQKLVSLSSAEAEVYACSIQVEYLDEIVKKSSFADTSSSGELHTKVVAKLEDNLIPGSQWNMQTSRVFGRPFTCF